jgi:hypothetical protein
MNRVRLAAAVLALLSIHIAVDGAVPFLLGWKVPLGMVPFFVAGAVFVVSLALFVADTRARRFGLVFGCAGAFIAAASIIAPLALDGEFFSSSYPYPGGKLFGLIQFAGFTTVAVLLRRRFASNNSFESERNRQLSCARGGLRRPDRLVSSEQQVFLCQSINVSI